MRCQPDGEYCWIAHMVETINRWDGDCKLVYGRPRHPQSQGLVEQANGTVEKMIGAGMEQYQTKSWSKLLPIIQFNLNASKPSSTKIMPFEVFLNKKPNLGTKKEFVECNKEGNENICSLTQESMPRSSKELREIESIDKERVDCELSDSDDDKENQFKLQQIDIEKKETPFK